MNDNLWTNEQVNAMFECNESGREIPSLKVIVNSKKKATNLP